MTSLDERLKEVIALQFDPDWGAPFWLERAGGMNFEPVRDINCVADLAQFGPTPVDDLATKPVEYFIPRKFHDSLHELITSETGGTTGPPKRTVYTDDEYHAGFVMPFVHAASHMNFPANLSWLFIGPSGPHIIGKGARDCSRALGSIDPFSIDFDPRWFRKLAPGSFAQSQYFEHVLAQATAILESQNIGVLFSTPPVLKALGERLPDTLRERITGIHLGGMVADETFWAKLTGEWFPNAVALSGYGNSLVGVCLQLGPLVENAPHYFAHGNRMVVDVIEEDGNPEGHVFFHRIDFTMFLPNVLERDVATRAVQPDGAPEGFHVQGLSNPHPPGNAGTARDAGIY